MEFIRYIFSNFWIWFGFFILVAVLANAAVLAIKSVAETRRIKVYKIGGRWNVKISGAGWSDIDTVIKNVVTEKERFSEDIQ